MVLSFKFNVLLIFISFYFKFKFHFISFYFVFHISFDLYRSETNIYYTKIWFFCWHFSATLHHAIKALLHCEMFRTNCLAMFWGYKLHQKFHSVTYPATGKIAARQVAREVAVSRIKSYFSCNLSRNDLGRRICYTEIVSCELSRHNVAKTFHSVTAP